MSAAAMVRVVLDGREMDVPLGASVAAVMMNARLAMRRSVQGEPRAALCGMGTCHECRATIDGRAHQRACLVLVAPGMVIESDG